MKLPELIIIHYQTQTQRKIEFKPRIKLNHNICITSEEEWYHSTYLKVSMANNLAIT